MRTIEQIYAGRQQQRQRLDEVRRIVATLTDEQAQDLLVELVARLGVEVGGSTPARATDPIATAAVAGASMTDRALVLRVLADGSRKSTGEIVEAVRALKPAAKPDSISHQVWALKKGPDAQLEEHPGPKGTTKKSSYSLKTPKNGATKMPHA